MFHFVVTVFITVALTAHALIGCCWHHGHTTAHDCVAHEHGAAQHDLESESHDEDEFEEQESTPHSSNCEGSRCVFVRSAQSNPVASPLVLCELPFNTSSLGDVSPRDINAFRSEKSWDAWAEQAPLFLRQQVWLI